MRHLIPIAAIAVSLSLTAGYAPAGESRLVADMKQRAEPLLYALGLLGSPYKRGGTDPEKGVDCSGFVRHVYKQTEDIDLPHSAKAISQSGEIIKKNQLLPGDLVFFNTRRKSYSHVGIYAGDGKFVHATSSQTKRVMVSNMNDRYWSRHFDGARRLLDGQPTLRDQ